MAILTAAGSRRFEVFYSNRIEVLLEHLSEVVCEPLPTPLTAEVILIQSKGLERWLVQQLAEKFGIWANCSFPFPNAMMRRLFEAFFGALPPTPLYSPEVLSWRVLEALPACIGRTGFDVIRNYLDGDDRGLKAVQLSRRIADAFDQYTLFRPEMVLAWESGIGDDWQPVLWRELTAGCSEKHRAASRRDLMGLLESGEPDNASLPARISVFGIPTLPPFHLDVLHALSRRVRICLFLLNPCMEFWGDIATRGQELHGQVKAFSAGRPESTSHYEIGNSLLSSLGKQGRQFLNLLLDKDELVEKTEFHDPGEGSLLACIQSDILNLRERSRGVAEEIERFGDESIQVHSLHSPMREMEALHDFILSLFDELPDLEPRDIVVMAPRIEVYAPFISAVFGAAEERLRVPFSIADRRPMSQSLVIQAFLKMLDLCGGRFGVTEVLDLLDCPPVRARYELSAGDMETIQRWLEAAGVRWGINAEDRGRFGLPRFEENSWQQGLERLLLGYALPSEDGRLFENILPYDEVEGSESQVLGRLADFAMPLLEIIRSLESPRTPAEWRTALLDLLDRFILVDEDTAPEAQLIRSQLHGLAVTAELGGFSGTLGIEAVRYLMEEKLEEEAWSHGFLAGGVTFCEMLPMRSIPFRVVALVGMDGSAFPRQSRPPGFDLLSRDPHPGDRSLRDEDRYLFLEALLSARERLYISYVGQSIQDNSEIPPSPVVGELLDYIEKGFGLTADRMVSRHPLQAFSPAYFSRDTKLFSYSRENLDALRARRSPKATEGAPFMRFPAAAPPEEWKTLDIRDLKRFFRQPVEYFLKRRLGIRLEESRVRIDDREPFSLDALNRYLIEQEIFEKLLSGQDVSGLQAAIRSTGVLPPGTAGEVLFRESALEARKFFHRIQPLLRPEKPGPREVDLEISGFRLTGSIDDVRGAELQRHRCAKIKPKDQLAGWIDHLALNAVTGDATTIVAGKDCCYRFSAAPESRQLLGELLEVYWMGLREPLRFFPRSSLAFVETLLQHSDEEHALAAAGKAWTSGTYSQMTGEEDNPYNRLAFKNADPFDEPFKKLAGTVLTPLLKQRTKL